MTPDRLVIAFLAVALQATLLAAVIFRRRYRTCFSFTVYLVVGVLSSFLFAAWPERFYTWPNYLLRETAHNLIKFAIALELGYRTFRVFPGAWTLARRLVFVIVVVIAIFVITAITADRDPADIQVEWHARMLNGTIWLFTAIAVVVLWYRLPVDPFHKAILVGFVPYLLIFSFGIRALAEMGWEQARVFQRAHTLAYAALLLYWNRAAWAPVPAQTVAPRAVTAKQPEPA